MLSHVIMTKIQKKANKTAKTRFSFAWLQEQTGLYLYPQIHNSNLRAKKEKNTLCGRAFVRIRAKMEKNKHIFGKALIRIKAQIE